MIPNADNGVSETDRAMTAPRRRWTTYGPLWLTVSAILFAVMAVAVRLAGQRDIPGSETTLIRFLFGLMTISLLHKTGAARVRLRRIPLLIARGVSGGVAILFYFLSLSAAKGPEGTPLTNSVLLGNSYFIFAPLFGALLIRERLRGGTVLSVCTALLGLYLVVDPDLGHIRLGDLYGLIAGMLSGLAIVTIRELRKTEPAISVFLSLCVFGAASGLLILPAQGGVWPDAMGWLILVIMGISSTAGQLSMTHAMKYSTAGAAGIIQMTTVIYSSMVGILWLGDPFGLEKLAGALLVLVSAAYISFVQSAPPGE